MSVAKVKKSKREQLERANSTMFAAVAIGAVIVMFSIISARFMWNKKSYNDRVIVAKTKARDAITSNATNLDKLTEQFSSIENSASTNATTILHALPPVYDYASLTASINSIAVTSGVKLSGGVGEDGSADALSVSPVSQPVETPITLQVSGSYDAIKKFMTNLEKSIRPIQVNSAAFSGTNETLEAQIQGVTYYQPARSFDVTKMEVR